MAKTLVEVKGVVLSWKRASDLGARLRAVREALGLTQEQFAEVAGVVDQSISDYENGRSQPSRSRLERLARQLQVPVSIFREGGPDPRQAVERARMPQEGRTPRGPGRRAEDLQLRAAGHGKDAARLERLVTLMQVYRDAGRAVSPELLSEWLQIVADNGL